MANKKSWLLLPFTGASNKTKHGTAATHDGQHENQRAGENGAHNDFNRQKTAAEISKMKEEDVIADYNSPIHVWVVSTLFPLVAGM